MKKNKKRYTGYGLTFLCLAYIALALIAEIAAFIARQYVGEGNYALFVTLFFLPVSAAVATFGTIYFNNRSARCTNKILRAINKVAKGDFNARIEVNERDGAQFCEIYNNFNKMVDELSSVKTLREDYVRNFSHEIKTPIAAINGYAKLIAEGALTGEESAEALNFIIKETENLSRTSQNILLLSKVENQQVADRSGDYRLDLQIKQCIIMLANDWEKKNITISSDLQAVNYVGDEQLVKHIWVNLLSNAIKFTPKGGEIRVTLTQRAGKIIAEVADNGIGMTEEQAEHIFEKYYQAAAKGNMGNGLGLAIVKRICELVGGSVSVKSRLGEGSTFTVTL